MTLYTVHAPSADGRSASDTDRVAFVKDGFAWPALLVPILWLPYRRMWWPLLGFLAGSIAIGLLGRLVGEGPSTAIAILFSVWFALEANAMRRWTLARRGFALVGVVEGRDRDTAERRFFEDWLSGLGPSPAPAPAGPAAPRSAASGVIGLFPEREGRRT
ncbi:DUF2628 domain-containing protein [Chthonobacter rhizosphaerae]|uniref:DUF2628 domain-containing protein n=1 Tax=Chthonobacter rhizosphaerae TaxID=2735553 RepID=UPI0015EF8E32|nr:DUF2628 domain-containing protein [Chthonobacter rhizosphaerae]